MVDEFETAVVQAIREMTRQKVKDAIVSMTDMYQT